MGKTGACRTIYLCFHCATAGSPLEWGAEDQELISVAWNCVDSSTKQVVSSRHSAVLPTLSEVPLEAFLKFGFTEEAVQNAKPLADILRELHQTIITSPDTGPVEVIPVTAGVGVIRQALHAETAGKEMEVPDYFYRFVDILAEWAELRGQPAGCSLADIALALDFKVELCDGSGLNESALISEAVKSLLEDGQGLPRTPFGKKETISKRLETAPCTKTEVVDDETVIKVRGLPWQSSDQDVAQFFRGLDIAKGGVALCLNAQGRRNGEALVRFTSQMHRDLALLRHKRHMGSRYIEVYRSAAEDFLKIAADTNNEAIGFLSNGDNIIIKMRGLPFSATSQDVLEFFGPELPIISGAEGVLFVRYPDGRSTGDAFVQFATEDLAREALKLHKADMRERYIELFRSTAAEVIQVMKRFSNPPLLPHGPPTPLGQQQQNPLLPYLLSPQQQQAGRNCLLLRNLPHTVKVEQIIVLLGEHSNSIRQAGIHMVLNQQGRPCGDCFIQMTSEMAAMAAAASTNDKVLEDCKVQAAQCSADDMNSYFVQGSIGPAQAPMLPFPGLFPGLFPNPAAAAALAQLQPGLKALQANPYLQAMYGGGLSPVTPPVSPAGQATLLYGQPNFTAVRMKGLPADATVQDIMNFFTDYIIPEHAIQPVMTQFGKPTGECCVMFYSPEIARQVIAEKHKAAVRNHVIELSIVQQ